MLACAWEVVPSQWSRSTAPIGDAGVESLTSLLAVGIAAPFQRPLPQDLPEALNETEPGSGAGHGDEVEAGRSPVPHPGVQRPRQRQSIGDEGDRALRDEGLQAVEEVDPGGGVAPRGRLEHELAAAVVQRPERQRQPWRA